MIDRSVIRRLIHQADIKRPERMLELCNGADFFRLVQIIDVWARTDEAKTHQLGNKCENCELMKDAERYRWIKQTHGRQILDMEGYKWSSIPPLDKLIDIELAACSVQEGRGAVSLHSRQRGHAPVHMRAVGRGYFDE